VRPRVPETDQGIQGGPVVELYDKMQRRLRDRDWIETRDVLRAGIARGDALEIGPGPGYLGLEWLANTDATCLTGFDISPDMIALARRNADGYKLSGRATYVCGSAASLPFGDRSFDAVFTAGSLHEWSDPAKTLREAWRVLKPGGRLLVMDFRRDMPAVFKWSLWLMARPKAMRPGLLSSIGAAYTPGEVSALVEHAGLPEWVVDGTLTGLKLSATRGALLHTAEQSAG